MCHPFVSAKIAPPFCCSRIPNATPSHHCQHRQQGRRRGATRLRGGGHERVLEARLRIRQSFDQRGSPSCPRRADSGDFTRHSPYTVALHRRHFRTHFVNIVTSDGGGRKSPWELGFRLINVRRKPPELGLSGPSLVTYASCISWGKGPHPANGCGSGTQANKCNTL